MPRARDFLERMRPIGAPGAAGPAGVPADRRAEVAAELEPVFAALTDIEVAVLQLQDTATAEADRRRSQAARRVEEILTSARGAAEAERAAVAARLRHQADVAAAAALAEAERAAERIRGQALRRLPALVATVVDRVRADLREVGPAEVGPGKNQ